MAAVPSPSSKYRMATATLARAPPRVTNLSFFSFDFSARFHVERLRNHVHL